MSADSRLARAFSAVALALLTGGVSVTAGAHDLTGIPDLLNDPLKVPQLTGEAPVLSVTGENSPCAQDHPDATPWSLAEAVQAALCNNVQLRGAWAAARVQAAAVGEARSAYLPKVNVGLSRLTSRTTYTTADTSDGMRGIARNASLTWRLFDFGAREAALDQSNQLLRAAMAARDANVQKLVADVVGAYVDAVTSQASQVMRYRSVELSEETVRAAERRERRGAGSGNDVLQAQASHAKARLALERASGEERKARSTLAFLMGRSPADQLPLPANLEAPPAETVDDLKQWLSEAQANHPQIEAARAQILAAEARIASTRREGLPSVDFTYSYYANGYPNQGLNSLGTKVSNYGLAVSLPLFEGFARTYRVRGAQAQREQGEANLQQIQQQVALDVLKAHADASTALSSVTLAAQLTKAAEAAAQSSTRRYDKGVADILELLNAQSGLAEARQEQVRCLAEWQAARLRLLAASGQFGKLASP